MGKNKKRNVKNSIMKTKILISYMNEEMRSYNKNETDWITTFSTSSGKLATISNSVDRNISFEYSQTGKQKQVLSRYPIGPDAWLLNYDEKNRLNQVAFILEGSASARPFSTASFIYPDNETLKPSEIMVIDKNETYEARIDLKWNDENITALTFEGTDKEEAFSGRIEYTYDDNINPYHILLKNQFGFDDFFAYNISLEMTTIKFGPANWQSTNNITQIAIFDTPNASEPIEVLEYDIVITKIIIQVLRA